MTQEEILEFDRRCAEFLNGKYLRNEELSFEPKGRWYIDKFPDSEQDYNLKFHSDWNWIMEVVEVIEKLGYWVCIQGTYIGFGNKNDENAFLNYSFSSLRTAKKEAVVQAINQFLICYNENKQR